MAAVMAMQEAIPAERYDEVRPLPAPVPIHTGIDSTYSPPPDGSLSHMT